MDWSKLSHLQIGKYGEYLAKMEFTKHGFDVYTAEVDDKGIDFVIRKENGQYVEIQVKSVRPTKTNQSVYLRKEVFKPKENLYLALLIFNGYPQPSFLLIPSIGWLNKQSSYFIDNNYEGKKSKPEFGIRLSDTNIKLLEKEYLFSNQVSQFNL